MTTETRSPHITRANDAEPRWWVTQIADVPPRHDEFDFGGFGDPLLECNTVSGAGIVQTDHLAYCSGRAAIDQLLRFNAAERDYVLIYPASLTTMPSSLRL